MLGPIYKEAVLEMNASDDRYVSIPLVVIHRSGIDTIREKVKMFAQKKVTLPEGKHKIIILDEADRYSYPQPLLFQLVSRQLPSRPWEEQWSSTPQQPVSPLLAICPPKSLSPFRYSLCSFLKSTSQDVPFWDIQSSQTSRFWSDC